MLHKRGLSPQDLETLEPEILNALYIYDSHIEPNGARLDMIKHASLCDVILKTSQSITKEGRKNAKLTDWDFLELLSDDSLTVLEKVRKREEEKEQNNKNNINTIGEMIRRQATQEGKNGKE